MFSDNLSLTSNDFIAKMLENKNYKYSKSDS